MTRVIDVVVAEGIPKVNDFIEQLIDEDKVNADAFLAQRPTVVLNQTSDPTELITTGLKGSQGRTGG
jgi:hypothetical protein